MQLGVQVHGAEDQNPDNTKNIINNYNNRLELLYIFIKGNALKRGDPGGVAWGRGQRGRHGIQGKARLGTWRPCPGKQMIGKTASVHISL